MTPKVSVIVPVYNMERYIVRCLDSLRAQTLRELEFVVVDDGSTDDSGRIADRYAAEDGRFRVTHGENRGLSAARNLGIGLSSGEYIMFLDSDDWVEPDFCRVPYEIAAGTGADLVMFRHWRDGFPDGSTERPLLPEGLLSAETAMTLLYHGLGVAAWNKLYRRTLFDGIRYPEGYVYEDAGTTYRLVHAAKTIRATNAVLYHYCFRKDSIINTRSIDHSRNLYEMRMQAALELETYGYRDLANEFMADTALAYLSYFGRAGKLSKDCLRVLCEEKRPLTNGTWTRRALVRLLRTRPRLFDLICVLCGRRRKGFAAGRSGMGPAPEK